MVRLSASLLFAVCRASPAVIANPPADPTPVRAEESSVRAAISAVLTQMSAAALAGDPAAYLAHVVSAPADHDPEADPGLALARFRKEQQNWADDLAAHKPILFELTLDPDPAIPNPPTTTPYSSASSSPTPTRFRCTLTLRYQMSVGAATHPTRASWPAVFERREDPNGQPRWLYAGEDWRTLGGLAHDGTPFVVCYFPGDEAVAADVLKAFPIAKAHDDEGFQIACRTPQTIKLYRSMEHLKATVYLSMPDRVLGGWNEPGESIKFMASYTRGVGPGGGGWTGAFAHEYGHVATWELGPHAGDMPWWVQEGVAELAASGLIDNYHQSTDRLIRSLARRGDLAPWSQISDYRNAPANRKHLAYRQGYHLLAYITTRWEREGRNAWLRRMAAGETLDQATHAQFGVSFAELDAAWRTTLPIARPTPSTPPSKDSREPAPPIPPAPTTTSPNAAPEPVP